MGFGSNDYLRVVEIGEGDTKFWMTKYPTKHVVSNLSLHYDVASFVFACARRYPDWADTNSYIRDDADYILRAPAGDSNNLVGFFMTAAPGYWDFMIQCVSVCIVEDKCCAVGNLRVLPNAPISIFVGLDGRTNLTTPNARYPQLLLRDDPDREKRMTIISHVGRAALPALRIDETRTRTVTLGLPHDTESISVESPVLAALEMGCDETICASVGTCFIPGLVDTKNVVVVGSDGRRANIISVLYAVASIRAETFRAMTDKLSSGAVDASYDKIEHVWAVRTRVIFRQQITPILPWLSSAVIDEVIHRMIGGDYNELLNLDPNDATREPTVPPGVCTVTRVPRVYPPTGEADVDVVRSAIVATDVNRARSAKKSASATPEAKFAEDAGENIVAIISQDSDLASLIAISEVGYIDNQLRWFRPAPGPGCQFEVGRWHAQHEIMRRILKEFIMIGIQAKIKHAGGRPPTTSRGGDDRLDIKAFSQALQNSVTVIASAALPAWILMLTISEGHDYNKQPLRPFGAPTTAIVRNAMATCLMQLAQVCTAMQGSAMVAERTERRMKRLAQCFDDGVPTSFVAMLTAACFANKLEGRAIKCTGDNVKSAHGLAVALARPMMPNEKIFGRAMFDAMMGTTPEVEVRETLQRALGSASWKSASLRASEGHMRALPAGEREKKILALVGERIQKFPRAGAVGPTAATSAAPRAKPTPAVYDTPVSVKGKRKRDDDFDADDDVYAAMAVADTEEEDASIMRATHPKRFRTDEVDNARKALYDALGLETLPCMDYFLMAAAEAAVPRPSSGKGSRAPKATQASVGTVNALMEAARFLRGTVARAMAYQELACAVVADGRAFDFTVKDAKGDSIYGWRDGTDGNAWMCSVKQLRCSHAEAFRKGFSDGLDK